MKYRLAYEETSKAYVTIEAESPIDAMNKIEVMKDCGEIDSKMEVVKTCISVIDYEEEGVKTSISVVDFEEED